CEIAPGLRRIELQLGRDLLHLGKVESLQDADIEPADVELVPAVGETRRARVRMMVVVQLFPADQDSPRHDVGAGVFRLKNPVAPVVPDAVDDARGEQGYPRHLYRPDRDAGESE